MIGLMGCEKFSTSVDVNVNSAFTVKEGAYFKVFNFKWYLKNIVDNRCPRDANCIRAGEALVDLVITNSEVTDFHMELCVGPDCNKRPDFYTFSVSGIKYKLILLSVDPFPQASGSSQRKTATFKLIVV